MNGGQMGILNGVREGFAGFGLEDTDEGAGLDIGFVFIAFGGGQFAFVAFLGQFFDTGLCAFANLERCERASRFHAETAAHRFEHLLESFAVISVSVSHGDNINSFAATKATRSATLQFFFTKRILVSTIRIVQENPSHHHTSHSGSRHRRGHSRKRAVYRILLGIGLIALNILLIPLHSHGMPDVVIAVIAILLTTFGFLSYFQGCFRMARAKGYDDSIMLGVMVVGVLCCPGLMLLAVPLILAFFLKDKTQRRY